jgi:hypothetical protein
MPGTGKTAVIEAIFSLHCEEGTGKDLGKVAVVTQGGCMAEELCQRGLNKAKNIHTALKERYTKIDGNVEDDSSRFDYEKVTTLIIDEFSNVSDSLAASIYDKTVFPNLKSIIHFYDSAQTQSIEPGSLSTDYIQCFPTIQFLIAKTRSVLYKQMRHIIQTTHLTDEEPQILLSSLLSEPLDFVELLYIASRWIVYLRRRFENGHKTYQDALSSVLFPGGVTIALTRVHRFNQESLLKHNDGLVLGGCIQPFVFDDKEFKLFQMERLFGGDLSLIKEIDKLHKPFPHNTLKTWNLVQKKLERCGGVLGKDLSVDAIYDFGGYYDFDTLSEYLCFKSRDSLKSFSANKETQILTLVNEHCRQVNLICDFLHNWRFHKCSDEHRMPFAPLFTISSSKTDDKVVVPLISRGSKLLSRDKRHGKLVSCDIMNTEDSLSELIRYCHIKLVIPKILLPKKGDLLHGGENDTDTWATVSNDATEIQAKYVRDLWMELEADKVHSIGHYTNIIKRKTAHFKDIPTMNLHNGTNFTFYGIVDLYVGSICPKTIFRELLKEQQRLVDFLTASLSTCKGPGSVIRKRDIRSEVMAEHRKLFTTKNICDILLEQELRRWRVPYTGWKDYRWWYRSDKEFHRKWQQAVLPYLLKATPPPMDASKGGNTDLNHFNVDPCKDGLLYGPFTDEYQRFMVTLEGKFIALHPQSMPVELFQPGWAITANFSQGKEYNHTHLVLPKYDNKNNNSNNQSLKPSTHTVFANFDRSHVHVSISRPRQSFNLYGDSKTLQEIGSRKGGPGVLTDRLTLMKYLLKLWMHETWSQNVSVT